MTLWQADSNECLIIYDGLKGVLKTARICHLDLLAQSFQINKNF